MKRHTPDLTITLNRTLDRKQNIAIIYNNLGKLFHRRGEFDNAEDILMKAVKLSEEVGRVQGIAEASLDLGDLLADLQRTEHAEVGYRNALRLARQMGAKPLEQTILGKLAKLTGDRNE